MSNNDITNNPKLNPKEIFVFGSITGLALVVYGVLSVFALTYTEFAKSVFYVQLVTSTYYQVLFVLPVYLIGIMFCWVFSYQISQFRITSKNAYICSFLIWSFTNINQVIGIFSGKTDFLYFGIAGSGSLIIFVIMGQMIYKHLLKKSNL